MSISWNYNGDKTVSKKNLQGQEGKKFFRKKKKIYVDICSVYHIYFQSASEIYFLGSRKTEMSNCIIPLSVPTVVEMAMEAPPLLIIYVFNQDGHEPILKMG